MDMSMSMRMGALARKEGVGEALNPLLAQVKAGTDSSTSATLLIVTDSGALSKASDAGDNVDAFKNTWPVVMRGLAVADGINCRCDAWANAGYGYATVADAEAFRPEIDYSTNGIAGRSGFSTRTMEDNNVGQGPITLTPALPYNGVKIWNIVEAVSFSAQFTAKVNGVTEATISGSTSGTSPGVGGTARQQETVITGLTKQVQSVACERVASVVRLSAIIPFNTDESEFILLSVAASGMSTTQATATTVSGVPKDYCMGSSGTYLDRDDTLIDLSRNDIIDGVGATGTYRTNLAALRANHGAAGTVRWIVPYYMDTALYSAATQEAYHAEIIAIATANGDKYLDLRAKFGSYADMLAAGDIAADGIHLSKQGHAKVAAWIWEWLKVA